MTIYTLEKIRDSILHNNYVTITNFRNGYSVIRIGTKFFHMRKDKTTVNDIGYHFLRPYRNDYSVVKMNRQWYHIDENNKPIYEARFDRVTDFNKHKIAKAVLNGEEFCINTSGKRVINTVY